MLTNIVTKNNHFPVCKFIYTLHQCQRHNVKLMALTQTQSLHVDKAHGTQNWIRVVNLQHDISSIIQVAEL